MTTPNIAHDFDHFRAAHPLTPDDVRYARILGQVVPIPTDMPAAVLFADIGTLEAPNPKVVRELIIGFYGEDVFTAWLAGGEGGRAVGLRDLMVIVGWSAAQAQGTDLTFGEAEQRIADETERMAAKAAGTDPALQRNAALSAAAGAATSTAEQDAAAAHAQAVADAGKALSFGTGTGSRPTSDASTGSGPTSSPGWAHASSAPFYGG